jgi:DNA-directed RNA polymerase subunit E'/Rpb7
VLALARKMLNGRSRTDILDGAYHRYAFHDADVPKWFYEDEKRHMRCDTQIRAKVARWDQSLEDKAGSRGCHFICIHCRSNSANQSSCEKYLVTSFLQRSL